MNAMNQFKLWLAGIAGAKSFDLRPGHWLTYDASNSKKYIAYSVNGGKAPREVNTRFATINVTIVGEKHANYTTIAPFAELLMQESQEIPLQCGIVTVNALGDILGPMQSEAERPLLNITFEIIT